MKKFCFVLGSALLVSTSVWAAAATEEISALERVLSTSYGAAVQVDTSAGQCRIRYPQTTVRANQFNKKKTSSSMTLPASEATCRKIDDFKSYPQYHISSSSPNKIKAQIYNLTNLDFIKDIEIQSLREEWDIVPELAWIPSQTTQARGIAYAPIEDGQKEQLASLASYSSQQQFSETGNRVDYKLESNFNDLKVDISFISGQIQSGQSHSDMAYVMPPTAQFDYQNAMQNIGFIASANSSAFLKGIKIDVPMLAAGIGLDITTTHKSELTPQKTINSLGTTVFKNIVLSTAFIEREKQPQNITIKYSLQGIPVETLSEFAQLSEGTDEDTRKLQFARLLDSVADKTKAVLNLDIYFPEASILGTLSLTRRNGYAYGTGSIKVNNLYKLFPQQAACAGASATARKVCPNDELFSMLGDVIDITKNNSETTYKLTEEGIFKNNVKIAPPLELNFEKMYRERQAADKELERSHEAWQAEMQRMEDEINAENI